MVSQEHPNQNSQRAFRYEVIRRFLRPVLPSDNQASCPEFVPSPNHATRPLDFNSQFTQFLTDLLLEPAKKPPRDQS